MGKDERMMPEGRPAAASLTSGLLARRGDARPAMRRQPLSHLHLPVEAHEDLGWNDIGEDQGQEQHDLPTTSLAAMTPPDHHMRDDADDEDKDAVGEQDRYTPEADYRDDEPEHDPEHDDSSFGQVAAPAPQAAAPEPEPAPAPQSPPMQAPTAQPAADVPPGISPLTRHLEAIAQRISEPPRDTSFKPMVARKVAPRKTPPAEHAASTRKAAFTLRLDPERHLRLRLLSALNNRSSQHLLIEALDALLTRDDRVEELARQAETNNGSAMPDSATLRRHA